MVVIESKASKRRSAAAEKRRVYRATTDKYGIRRKPDSPSGSKNRGYDGVVQYINNKPVLIKVEKPEIFEARTSGGTLFAKGTMADIRTAERKKAKVERTFAERELKAQNDKLKKDFSRQLTREIVLKPNLPILFRKEDRIKKDVPSTKDVKEAIKKASEQRSVTKTNELRTGVFFGEALPQTTKEDIEQAKKIKLSKFVADSEKKDFPKLVKKVTVSRLRQEEKTKKAAEKSKQIFKKLDSFNLKVDSSVRKGLDKVFELQERASKVGVLKPFTKRKVSTFQKETVKETTVLLNQFFNPLVFGTNIGGGLAVAREFSKAGTTKQVLSKVPSIALKGLSKGFDKVKTIKKEDVLKGLQITKKGLKKLVKEVKDGEFNNPKDIAIGLTLIAIFRPDKLAIKGGKGLTKKLGKAQKELLKDVNIKRALNNALKSPLILITAAGGKGAKRGTVPFAKTAAFKKSTRIVKQLKKAPSKVAIKKRVAASKLPQAIKQDTKLEKLGLVELKVQQSFVAAGKGIKTPVSGQIVKTTRGRDFKFFASEAKKEKRFVSASSRLGTPKSQQAKKAKQVVQRLIQKQTKSKGGLVQLQKQKVVTIQKFDRVRTASTKLSLKQSQKLTQSLAGKNANKKKIVQKIVGSSKEQTFTTTPSGAVKGFRSQKLKDKLLKKLADQVKLSKGAEARLGRAFVKSLNTKIKTLKGLKAKKASKVLNKVKTSTKKKVKKLPTKKEGFVSEKVSGVRFDYSEAELFADKGLFSTNSLSSISNDSSTFGSVANKAKELLKANFDVKAANDLSRKIKALSIIRSKSSVSVVSKPKSRISIKATQKPKEKIDVITSLKKDLTFFQIPKIVSKPVTKTQKVGRTNKVLTLKKSINKVIKFPKTKITILPKKVKTIRKIVKPIKKFKKFKVLKFKLKPVKKVSLLSKKELKAQTVFFTPTIIRPSKKVDEDTGFMLKKVKLFTGSELR